MIAIAILAAYLLLAIGLVYVWHKLMSAQKQQPTLVHIERYPEAWVWPKKKAAHFESQGRERVGMRR